MSIPFSSRKRKKEESKEKNCAAREDTKAADISSQTTLEKATVEKPEAVENKDKRVQTVGNITRPRMAAILVTNINNVRVQTSNQTLRLDCIVALNASGVLNNGAVV